MIFTAAVAVRGKNSIRVVLQEIYLLKDKESTGGMLIPPVITSS
jgi:hypothetical protein